MNQLRSNPYKGEEKLIKWRSQLKMRFKSSKKEKILSKNGFKWQRVVRLCGDPAKKPFEMEIVKNIPIFK